MTERGALTEHAAPERLVVARGLFSGPSAQVSDEMYARILSGKAHSPRRLAPTLLTEQLTVVSRVGGPESLLLRSGELDVTRPTAHRGDRDVQGGCDALHRHPVGLSEMSGADGQLPRHEHMFPYRPDRGR